MAIIRKKFVLLIVALACAISYDIYAQSIDVIHKESTDISSRDLRLNIFLADSESIFESKADSLAYMRLQQLREMDVDDMTSDELEEYSFLKSSDIDAKYTQRLMPKAQRSGSSSFCSNAIPFCTDEGGYEFAAGTSSTGATEFGNNGRSVSCLNTTPSPAWFYMQISGNQTGNLLIYMSHSNGKDIDFVCWGPFTASSAEELLSTNCVGELQDYDNGNHRPSQGDHVTNGMGGYPEGNVVDCSYDPASTEWCYIPDAEPGQWYIFLITNYSKKEGNIVFEAIDAGNTYSMVSTNCNIVANINNNSPLCEGATINLSCAEVGGATSYTWYFNGENQTPRSSTSIATGRSLSISNATTANSGWYELVITTESRSNSFYTYVTVIGQPTISTISASPAKVCSGATTSLSVTASEGSSFLWSSGAATATASVAPTATTTYYVTASRTVTVDGVNYSCSAVDDVTVTVFPNPTVSISPSEISICSGTTTTLTSDVRNCNSCSYLWSNDATTSSLANVSTAGTYTLTVTSTNASTVTCTASASAVVNVNQSGSVNDCNVIYVSTSGNGTGYLPTSPTDIATALGMAECSGATIKMEQGTYNINSPLQLVSNVTIEGGYVSGTSFQQKTSQAGATTINRTAINVEGAGTSAARLVAFEGSSVSGFRLQDLTVTTANAPQQSGTVTVTEGTINSYTGQGYGYSVNMPKTGTSTSSSVTTGFKVYDDRGSGSSYSNSCNGYLILKPANGGKLRISGTVKVETCCDYLEVYSCDANGNNTATLRSGPHGSSGDNPGSYSTYNINFTSTDPSGCLKLRFYSDYQNNYTGLDLEVEECCKVQTQTLTQVQKTIYRGASTYAIHLSNCSNYSLVRCQLKPGNAANGSAGYAGIDGLAGVAGEAGTPGTVNHGSNGGGSGGVGGPGAGTGTRKGGAGGAGGQGEFVSGLTSNEWYGFPGSSGSNAESSTGAYGIAGSCGKISGDTRDCGNRSSLECSGCGGVHGENGTAGSDGYDGTTYANAQTPLWESYFKLQDGSNGGDAGGGGGGGGASGGCNKYRSPGPYRAVGGGGGGGGGGGQGGTGGTGGYGGGASFGLYLYKTTLSGITDCFIQSGTAGSGGTGGAGGTGGSGGVGGSGGAGRDNNKAVGGNGGVGGDGGAGGNGGNGQKGSDGVSYKIAVVGASGLTSSATTGYDFNLSGQTVITAGSEQYPISSCTGTCIAMSGATFTSYGTNASTENCATGTVKYNDTGYKTPVTNASTNPSYTGFIRMISSAPDVSSMDVDGPIEICCSGTYEFCLTNLPTSTPLSYQWTLVDNGDGTAAISGSSTSSCVSLNVTTNSTAHDEAKLRVQISSACCGIIKVIDFEFDIKAALGTLTATSPVSACIGDDLTLSPTIPNSANVCSLQYQWYNGTTAIGGANSATYTINDAQASDAGTYTLHAITSCGESTVSMVVNMKTPPDIEVTSGQFCPNAMSNFTVTLTPAMEATITYTINDVTPQNASIPESGTLNISAGELSEDALLRITSMTANGCTTNPNYLHTIDILDVAGSITAGQDQTVCGTTAIMAANTLQTGWTGNWTTTASNITITNSTTSTATVTYSGTAFPFEATLTWTLTNTTCNTSETDDVVITFQKPVSVVASANSPVCKNGTLNLTATPDVPDGVTPTYSWIGPNGFVSTQQNPSRTSMDGNGGTYSVTIRTTDCEYESTVSVSVVDNITASVTPNPTGICVGDEVTLTASISGSPTQYAATDYTYTWSPNLGSTASVTDSPDEASSYSVTVTNTACSATASASVSINDDITVTTLSADSCDRQLTLKWTAVTGATGYTIYYGQSSTLPAASSVVLELTLDDVTVSGNEVSYTIPDLTNDRNYYFAVMPTGVTGKCGQMSSIKHKKPKCLNCE